MEHDPGTGGAGAVLGVPRRVGLAGAVPAWRAESRATAFEWQFVVLGGLPLVLPVVLYLGEQQLSSQAPINYYYWMNALISAPHVYATYLRLGRKIHERRVSWVLGFPAYAAGVALLGLASWAGFYLQAMTAVNVVQSYHYWRQAYGVHRLYARQAGAAPAELHAGFVAFHLAAPLLVLGRWDTLHTVWGGRPSDVIIPVAFPGSLLTGLWLLAGAGAAWGLLAEWRRLRRTGVWDLVPTVTLIVAFAIHAYGFLSVTHYLRGFMTVTIFHAVQYLGLVWMLERRAVPGRAGAALRGEGAGFAGFLLVWVALLGAGLVWETWISVAPNRWLPHASAVLLAAISAHHYFVDGFLWRARVGR